MLWRSTGNCECAISIFRKDFACLIKNLFQKNVRNFTLTLPKQSAAGADHSKLWTAEKVVSLVILGVLPAAILVPCRPLDTILAISLVMHSHWGIEALITDYVRESMFGTVVPKLTHGTMILISATVLGGLLYFIYADVGLGQAVRKLWTIKAQ